MSDLSSFNPQGRFTGLAELYAQCRPDYPEKAVDFIVAHSSLAAGSLLVDVGCGTGISSRPFVQLGIRVIGIEPNADMRARAVAEPVPAGCPAPEYRAGQAEATGLPDACAAVVLTAQAFHWFERDTALREFRRILKPGGWTVLVWNERDESDPFTQAYGAAVRASPGATAIELPRGRAGHALLESPLFEAGERVVFGHGQLLDERGVLGRAFSASYAPREPAAAEALASALREAFRRYQQQGRVVLRYETSVYVARKR